MVADAVGVAGELSWEGYPAGASEGLNFETDAEAVAVADQRHHHPSTASSSRSCTASRMPRGTARRRCEAVPRPARSYVVRPFEEGLASTQ